jgi:DNA-binding LacI/PurR family transcriptional regulator
VKPATIYDVAERAGVSHQTVTRFLHGFEGIRPHTRERVEQAITELDYKPNAAARLLRSRRSNRIGVLADSFNQGGPNRILGGASAFAHQHGYVLDLVMVDGDDPSSVAASLAILQGHQVAGIMATAQTELVLQELRRQTTGAPLVIDSADDDDAPAGANHLAGTLAADHLMDLGHRRIGYLAGSEPWLAARQRATGFAARVAERGGTLVWRRHGDWSAESGFACWDELDPADRRVTAVATGNDSMAIGLMSAAVQSGIAVPGDLSIIGVDDLPEARFVLPALSTVAMDFEGEGEYMIAALIAQIEPDVARPTPQPFDPHVVARSSTGPVETPM